MSATSSTRTPYDSFVTSVNYCLQSGGEVTISPYSTEGVEEITDFKELKIRIILSKSASTTNSRKFISSFQNLETVMKEAVTQIENGPWTLTARQKINGSVTFTAIKA